MLGRMFRTKEKFNKKVKLKNGRHIAVGNRKKAQLFEKNKYFSVIPTKKAKVYRRIVEILKMQEKEETNYTDLECKEFVQKMMDKEDLILIAELLEDEICISVLYIGNTYLDVFKTKDYWWFKKNFSKIE